MTSCRSHKALVASAATSVTPSAEGSSRAFMEPSSKTGQVHIRTGDPYMGTTLSQRAIRP